MDEDESKDEAFEEFLKKSREHLEEITALMEKDAKEKVIIKDGIDKFSDSLEELINVSGDINDQVNLNIILNALSNKLFTLIIKETGHPMLYIEKITSSWKFGLDKYIDELKEQIKEKKNAS